MKGTIINSPVNDLHNSEFKQAMRNAEFSQRKYPNLATEQSIMIFQIQIQEMNLMKLVL